MDLMVFEDQTGKMLYPEKKPEENEQIKTLFAGHIILYIGKRENELEICCRVFVQDSMRINGYYIVYKGEYPILKNSIPNIFNIFKEESEIILKKLGFEPSHVKTADEIFDNNIIFDNIEKFSSDDTKYIKDVDDAIKILKSQYVDIDKQLEYKAGKVDEIAKFCQEMLREFDKIRIVISSKKSKYGDINIVIKNYNDHFISTEKVKQSLDKYNQLTEKKRIEEEAIKKVEEEKSNKEKIENRKDKIKDKFFSITSGEEFRFIRDETQSLEDNGHDPTTFIKEEINNFYDKVATPKMISKGSLIDKTNKEKKGFLDIILLGIAIFMLGLVVGTLVLSPYLLSKKDIGSQEIPTTPTVTENPTPKPTKTVKTVVDMTTPIPTIPNNDTNNNSNKSNATNNESLPLVPIG